MSSKNGNFLLPFFSFFWISYITFGAVTIDVLELDRLKAAAGKYGKVSRRGLYAGLVPGRFGGGYTGKEIGEELEPGAEIIDPLALDPGHLGPEEATVYTLIAAGYFAGGLGVAKAFTKYQELRDQDLKYTRPFVTPLDGWRAVKKLLDEEETGIDERAVEGIDKLLEDEE